MNYYMSSGQLKYLARTQIAGRMGTVIGAFLVHMLLYLPLLFARDYIDTYKTIGLICYFIAGIAIDIYLAIITTGESLIYLEAASGEEPAVMDVLYGFRNDVKKIVYVRIIPILIINLVRVPGFILLQNMSVLMPDNDTMMNMLMGNDMEGFVELSLNLFPYTSTFTMLKCLELIIVIVVSIMFSQSIFMMLDYPDMKPEEIIKRSIALMKGNWGRYILVVISFIPWFLLGIITAYIAFVWVYPFFMATMTNFYIDLAKNNQAN